MNRTDSKDCESNKGFKQTEIGMIPNDWTVKKLGEIFSIFAGGDLRVEDFSSEKYDAYKYPIYSNSLSNKGLYGYSKSYRHEESCITVTARGTIGKANARDHKFDAIGRVLILKPLGKLNCFFFSEKINNEIKFAVESTGVPQLTAPQISQYEVALPPLSEQNAIAEALSDADELISSLERLIEKKRAIKQGAMQELLTGKRRLPGFSGEWVTKKLGEIGESIIGLTYKPDDVAESGLLVLRSSNIAENALVYDDNVFVQKEVSERIINRQGDILICVRNGSRNLIGKCAYITGQAVGQTFGAFMAVFRSTYNAFVFQAFQSFIVKRQIEEHIGATINQITNKNLNAFEIPFPEKQEQDAIVSILMDMDSEIQALEQKLTKYRQIKQGMMQELLTGRIRLV